MRVTLRINGKTYNYTSEVTKRKMTGAISRLERQNANLKGSCTVHYGHQYKNEFDFESPDDLRTKLWPAIETDLVKDFDL